MSDATGRKVLGITLDTMWSIKDYVLSGAVNRLGERFRVVAWVPPRFLEETRRLCSDAGATDVGLLPFHPFEGSPTFRAVSKLQKSLIYERYDIDTEKVYQRRSSDGDPGRGRSRASNRVSRAVRLVAKSPLADAVNRCLILLRRLAVPVGLYAADFETHGIDVVLTTDPTKRNEDPIYFEAKRRGVRLATLVLSWDNLTSKGVIHEGYDRVMVWNDLMAGEIARMYPAYSPGLVSVVGFPRFDIYGRPFPPPYQRGAFLRRIGLDPARPMVLFASCNAKAFRTQHQVIEHVYSAMLAGAFGPGVQLLIRSHPHDLLESYDTFRGREGVAVWPEPDRVHARTLYEQMPEPDELLVLGASIAHAAVVVTGGSSVLLDAARCDVPIVCIAYDGDETPRPEDSWASCYEYSHQKPLHRIGATEVCRSRDDLMASIRRGIQNPRHQSPARALLVERYLSGTGSSIDRIVAALDELAGARRG